ncbi:hypothetical protein BDV28DRAFT_132073 [Aspergillus coremiiformis]|uniref:Pentatricopeptide repeat protein n=1 Tax=Aspergillus coremiiformis TaxID=138285 RepID=A0A5N6Z8F2_9EURO|nr:hypothetical protein BDV28DRAFT_132073 [Aspergillus coremiiformis]
MLRCSNAGALRTGVKSGPAKRICPGRSWSRGIPAGTSSILLSSTAPAGLALRQNGVRRLPGDAKEYSTNLSIARPGFVRRRKAASNVFLSRDTRESKRAATNNDLLLAIAKAGTSPKVRKELKGTTLITVSGKTVEMELKWLQDPRALADRVAKLLSAHDVRLAVALVRGAEKESMECAVAWNHLLEYCLKRHNPEAAMKFYNEMKKRGRKPSSLTYTIMLDGLAKVPWNAGVHPVKTALSIYRSIFAPNSAVTPNIIHTNAMLNVCASHTDTEILWLIAGELPEQGETSPNCATYSIILRAITEAARGDISRMKASQTARMMARSALAVKEGKRIWSDIVFRWKKGEFKVDNILVNSMANLLLEGSTDRDCYDVFALINQATGIPIFAKEPPSNPHSQQPSLKLENVTTRKDMKEFVPFLDDVRGFFQPSEKESRGLKEQKTNEEEEKEETFETLFDPLGRPGEGDLTPLYISVGNRELSIILDTCTTMTQGLSLGKEYWQHLTQDDTNYKIEPDSGTYHQYLRLLRLGRSSRLTLDLIRDRMMPAGMVEGRSFRIGLATCLRDRNNINVFKNANGLLHIMETALPLPLPLVLTDYLGLVHKLTNSPELLMSLNGITENNKKPTGSLSTIGQKLRFNLQITATEVLRPSITKLSHAMDHGEVSPAPVRNHYPGNTPDPYSVSGEDALQVLTSTRRLIDEILQTSDPKLLSKETRAQLKQDSQNLSKYSDAEMVQKYQLTRVSLPSELVRAFKDQQLDSKE